MDWTITPQAPEATRTDTARIRNAFDALADRGVDTMAAQDVLHPLIDRIAEERNGATYRDLAPATDPTTAPLADPTAPDTAETTAIHRCVAQAVNVYNSRRPAFTIFDAVATESGIKSINRAVWLRGVRAGTESEARLAWVHVDKQK